MSPFGNCFFHGELGRLNNLAVKVLYRLSGSNWQPRRKNIQTDAKSNNVCKLKMKKCLTHPLGEVV